MKKLIIAVCLLSIYSCSPKGGSTTSVTPTSPAVPVSTFNITYNGKTYNLSTGSTSVPTIISAITGSSSSPAQWGVNVGAQNSHIQCSFMAAKIIDLGTAIGVYNKVGCGGGYTYSTLSLTDVDDGHKMYQTDCTGHDTTGAINITVSNATECKGTFSLTLTYNGNYFPATGDFDYKH